MARTRRRRRRSRARRTLRCRRRPRRGRVVRAFRHQRVGRPRARGVAMRDVSRRGSAAFLRAVNRAVYENRAPLAGHLAGFGAAAGGVNPIFLPAIRRAGSALARPLTSFVRRRIR